MNAVEKRMLKEIADLHDIPQGAYNIRKDGEGISRQSTANIISQSSSPLPPSRFRKSVLKSVEFLSFGVV